MEKTFYQGWVLLGWSGSGDPTLSWTKLQMGHVQSVKHTF